MKICVTGSNGLLGSEILKVLSQKGISVRGFDRSKIEKFEDLHSCNQLKGIKYLIHCAANTNVEDCEENPEKCYFDNTLFTEYLAKVSGNRKFRIIFISSAGVYGKGKSVPYTETDSPTPTTHHHNSKLLAEKAVQNFGFKPLILRVGWIFGGDPLNPKNFVARRIEEAMQSGGSSLKSDIEQFGSPTYVKDLARTIIEMLGREQSGLFNVANSGYCSRYEYVKEIIEISQIDKSVEPVSSNSFNRKAKVSNNESVTCDKLIQTGYSALPDWKSSLKNYIKKELEYGMNNENFNYNE